ncbi:DUF72 domain-containing protein [Mesonia sp. HuA40]|uniref:DUF72 domain-containing protein n=1 Tax=Mesonia sp. HuA40 TaxID=2602761 RepID=UPI0011CA6EF0|nr:DUF72 domain-containing protein [Mesonia sp. HuA40]TXK70955.1 DUF72 domain-containing protein [Mesonia sp. HuA40]
MKFGKIKFSEIEKLYLPKDHKQTQNVLHKHKPQSFEEIRIGDSTWTSLKPNGKKTKLSEYQEKLNAVELNASFYRNWSPNQYQKWQEQVDDNFKFCPKVPRQISHYKRLDNCELELNYFIDGIANLSANLGVTFLQMPENFQANEVNLLRLAHFIKLWPLELPLALELRNRSWFKEKDYADQLNNLLLAHNISSVITDTPGERSVLHMRLTTKTAFIRFNAMNDTIDYERINEWLDKIENWYCKGLKKLYFFIHQGDNDNKELLLSYFIKKLNKQYHINIKNPIELI